MEVNARVQCQQEPRKGSVQINCLRTAVRILLLLYVDIRTLVLSNVTRTRVTDTRARFGVRRGEVT